MARTLPAKRSPPLLVEITATTGRPFIPYLRRHLVAARALLDAPLAELSLALVGDARMAELHRRFMGIAGPTDVLTFPLDADDAGRPTSGEVIVCVPEARRRSAVEGTELRREVMLYALHGLLHLCGFDDRTDPGFRLMHRTEDAILSRLGVGPVFRARPRPAPRAKDARPAAVRSGIVRSAAVRPAARAARAPRAARGAD